MNKDNTISLASKSMPKMNGFPKIEFNPETTPQAESPTLNKYGFDLTNPDFIIYKSKNLEAEIIGGVNTLNLLRFNVMLKISRRPQMSALDVYRNQVDLYNENNLQHFIKQTSLKLKLDTTDSANFIYDLMERLENYRKDRLTYKEETFIVNSPKPKDSKNVKKLLESEYLIEELKELMKTAGMLSVNSSLQLFLIALSSKLSSPMHCIIQGNSEVSSLLIKDAVSLLPEEVSQFKTSLSDNVLYYTTNRNFWNHKVLALPTIDTLGKKNVALSELITQGEVNRMVTEANEHGNYKAKTRIVAGQPSFISSSSKGFHELFRNDNVIVLPIDNTKELRGEMASKEIKRHAGLINHNKVEKSKKLLQFAFRELKPVEVINPFLDELDVMQLFDNNVKHITQFLRLTNLVTLLHQKQLGVTKSGNAIQVEVLPKHMSITLELFSSLWLKEDEELNFRVSGTFKRIKEILKKEDSINFKSLEFSVKEIRVKLKMSPATLSRHINTLFDYGLIERKSGNRNKGFKYSVISWNENNSSADRYNTLKEAINSL